VLGQCLHRRQQRLLARANHARHHHIRQVGERRAWDAILWDTTKRKDEELAVREVTDTD
jgi:predicted nuclease of predicted toxin-antitoxin system